MIYFLGDLHSDFRPLHRLVQASPRPDAVILLGDIEAIRRPLLEEIAPLEAAGIKVFWIHGNHDTDRKQSWDNLATAMHLNIDGRVVEIDGGKRVAGLGGVFRSEIWYPPDAPKFETYEEYCRAVEDKRPIRLRKQQAREASLRHIEHLPGANAATIDEILFGRELKHRSSIFWDVYEKLWDEKADILVTHEAPSCHPHGFTEIDELARAMGVSKLFHGHHHMSYSSENEFQTFGVGLRGITDENGRVTVPGELDDMRRDRING